MNKISPEKFQELKQSQFYKNGQLRSTFSGIQVETVNAAFDTMLVESAPPTEFIWKGRNSRATGLYSNDVNGLDKLGEQNPINLQHLHKVLSIEGDYIPQEFRIEICRQWNEVNEVVNKIKSQSSAKVVASEIFLVCPDTNIGKHRHKFAKQTLTFGYRFSTDSDGSYLMLWPNNEEQHYEFPLSNKFWFTFKDHADHGAQVNSWMFFWFFDFDQHIDIPEEMPFVKTDTKNSC
jgi:hypothetical protein